jgi:hypothetical protein
VRPAEPGQITLSVAPVRASWKGVPVGAQRRKLQQRTAVSPADAEVFLVLKPRTLGPRHCDVLPVLGNEMTRSVTGVRVGKDPVDPRCTDRRLQEPGAVRDSAVDPYRCYT